MWSRTASGSQAPSAPRLADAVERALRLGGGGGRAGAGRCRTARATTWRYSTDLHCADCDIHYDTAASVDLPLQFAARRMRNLPRIRSRIGSTTAS